jgi:hypothetical protein
MKKFLKWNEEKKSKYSKIEFKDFGFPYGLGGLVLEDIKENEEIITVSLDIILNYKVALKTEFGKYILQIYEKELNFQKELKKNLYDENEMLINNYENFTIEMLIFYLFMIYERFDKNSYWEPTLSLLPKTFETPLYYNEEELNELKGTNLYTSTVGLKKTLNNFYSILIPFLTDFNSNFFNKNIFTKDNFFWAYSVIFY